MFMWVGLRFKMMDENITLVIYFYVCDGTMKVLGWWYYLRSLSCFELVLEAVILNCFPYGIAYLSMQFPQFNIMFY